MVEMIDFDKIKEENNSTNSENKAVIVQNENDSTIQAPINKIENVTQDTKFSQTVESGMIDMLQEAHINDNDFKQSMIDKIKESAVKRAELEKNKAELEQQNLQYQSDLLKTQQLLNEYQQEDDGYNAKRAKRQFVYDGIAPIMEWIGIKKPLNIPLMIFLTIILIVPFIIGKPLEALVVGADAEVRKQQAKAWLWTILALTVTAAVLCGILIPLDIYGII